MSLVYKPLDRVLDEIRALRLLSVEDQRDCLRYKLEHVSLSQVTQLYDTFRNKWVDADEKNGIRQAWLNHVFADDSHFMATTPNTDRSWCRYCWGDLVVLSYMWGDRSQTSTIIINDCPIKVTTNLEAALRAIRAHPCFRPQLLIWVDAVCIDQNNLTERSEEVSRMKMLYQEAIITFVYLGPDIGKSAEGAEVLRSIARTITLWRQPGFHTEENVRWSEMEFRMLEMLLINTGDGFKPESIASLKSKGLIPWDFPLTHGTDELSIFPYSPRRPNLRNDRLEMIEKRPSNESAAYLASGQICAANSLHDIDVRAGFKGPLTKAWDMPPIVTHQSNTPFQAMFDFLVRGYWWRVWILQELATAHNDAIVLCENAWLTLESLTTAIELLWQHEARLVKIATNELGVSKSSQLARTIYRVRKIRTLYSSGVHQNPFAKTYNAVILTQSANTSEPRDKIYGILGDMDQSISSRIVPDYALSPQQVYRACVETIITYSQNLNITFMGRTPTGLPSWIPNWSDGPPRNRLLELSNHSAIGLYASCISFHNSSLRCTGLKLDHLGTATSTRLYEKLAKGMPPKRLLRQSLTMILPDWQTDATFRIPWLEASNRQVSNGRPKASQKHLEYLKKYNNDLAAFEAFRIEHKDISLQTCTLRDCFESASARIADLLRFISCRSSILISLRDLVPSLEDRKLATTLQGMVAMVPRAASDGDCIFILKGCSCPLVLRPISDGYRLIGERYLHGVMNGEALDWTGENGYGFQDILLY